MAEPQEEPKTRLVARIVRDVLDREEFAALPDLTEAVKCECARHRIKWTNDAISEAYRLIESNRSLVIVDRSCRGQDPRPRPLENPIMREEATYLLRRLWALKDSGR